MSTAAQKLFKRIVLHNKVMDEATVDRLLKKVPDPEQLVKLLVQKQKLPEKTGAQLLGRYRKLLEKHGITLDDSPSVPSETTATSETTPQDAAAVSLAEPDEASPAVEEDDLPLLERDTDDLPA